MRKNSDKKLLMPIMDRLLAETDNKPLQPYQLLRQLRESVRRDLENLFNTRYKCTSHPDEWKNLRGSVLNYGLPDLSTINLTSIDSRKDFCKQIETAILAFEPRIKSVTVKSEKKIDSEDPHVRFRVEAVLHTNPAPELIVFDSALDLVSQTVDVSEVI